ncbi:hypothetical protein TNIN_297761 [Trichonephila inaurata madagascariensis]|uniref:Uncharacterized protein n=1 Tax=Trichonephila inaurata madagascariensis TaxID=2747483 RepID=A0A8X6XRJ7_9ARAC|nr:hypothetical protein TNIN_297761 [Trichonephila inaurata madagascariensis]
MKSTVGSLEARDLPFHQNTGAIRCLIFYAWRSLLNVEIVQEASCGGSIFGFPGGWVNIERGWGAGMRDHPSPRHSREKIVAKCIGGLEQKNSCYGGK